MAWVFTPYDGLSNIRFGQTKKNVEGFLGQPKKVKQTYAGKTRIEYSMSVPSFVFKDDKLVEMNVLPDVSEPLEYQGMDLFASPMDEVLRRLERDDSDVRESNGLVIFFGIGLALTGFHDEIPEQKAITIFGRDHLWIGKRPTMQPIRFS